MCQPKPSLENGVAKEIGETPRGKRDSKKKSSPYAKTYSDSPPGSKDQEYNSEKERRKRGRKEVVEE